MESIHCNTRTITYKEIRQCKKSIYALANVGVNDLIPRRQVINSLTDLKNGLLAVDNSQSFIKIGMINNLIELIDGIIELLNEG